MRLLFILLTTIYFVNGNNDNTTNYLEDFKRYYMSNRDSIPKTDGRIKILECAEQNQIDDKTYWNMINNKAFSATEKSRSFSTCLAKNIGMMNEDGTLSRQFSEFLDNPRYHKCTKNLGEDQKNFIAAKLMDCLSEN